jgi:hypothetical protein
LRRDDREAGRARGDGRGIFAACAAPILLAMLSVVALLFTAPLAHACPICAGTAPSLTLLQELINADRAVIARPIGGGDFEVLAAVKTSTSAGDGANGRHQDRRGERLRRPKFAPGEDVPMRADAPSVLLLRQSLGGAWVVAGPMPESAAPATRLLVGAKRSTDMTLADWQARVVLLAPLLEHPVPLLAETAYGEIARSPYAAMRSARGRVDPADLKVWLADPARAPRRSLYWLLYGINAGPAETRDIVARVDALGRENGVAELSSLLAADLEAGGATRRAVLRRRYFEDPRRTLPELQEAVLAFTVHADAGDAALRRDTATMFGRLVRTHRALGGIVAADLARWQYWEAVPDYIALLRSRTLHPVWRQPIIDYLVASGRPDALAAVRISSTRDAGSST